MCSEIHTYVTFHNGLIRSCDNDLLNELRRWGARASTTNMWKNKQKFQNRRDSVALISLYPFLSVQHLHVEWRLGRLRCCRCLAWVGSSRVLRHCCLQPSIHTRCGNTSRAVLHICSGQADRQAGRQDEDVEEESHGPTSGIILVTSQRRTKRRFCAWLHN